MKNIYSSIIAVFVSLLIFLFLIYFNQKQAQKQISLSRRPEYGITLLNPPSKAIANTITKFAWKIDSPNTAMASTTTIYYGYISSPSALTVKDSPEAVGYPYKISDYLNGDFFLPDIFSAKAAFLEGTIFYRAYAKVGDQHLWSKEALLKVYRQ